MRSKNINQDSYIRGNEANLYYLNTINPNLILNDRFIKSSSNNIQTPESNYLSNNNHIQINISNDININNNFPDNNLIVILIIFLELMKIKIWEIILIKVFFRLLMNITL